MGLGSRRKEGEGEGAVQRRLKESEMGKYTRLKKGAITPPNTLKEGGCGMQPHVGCGHPSSNTLAAAEGPHRGRQRICGSVSGRSVVELALARLVDEAALVLGPARTALAGSVLPLHRLGAQRVALCPLPGPLQPPHLARLLQQCSPRRQRGGCVVQGPGLAADWRQLPIAKVAIRQVRVGVRGRGPRLHHYSAASDVNGHAGVLDEEVL